MMTKFNVGDTVKLLRYYHWGDYIAHQGQAAIVKSKLLNYTEFDWEIIWSDGINSYVHESNLTLIAAGEEYELAHVINKEVEKLRGPQ